MTLRQHQELFLELIAEHILWLFRNGYTVTPGDFKAHDGHRAGSNHYIGLAADLNLFIDGEWLTEAMQHQESGAKWESRHPLCRWGGNWDKDTHPGEPGENDGNHYSLIYQGRM